MTSIVIADYQNADHQRALMSLLNGYATSKEGGGKSLTAYVQENLLSRLQQYPGAFSILAFVNDNPAGLVNCFETLSTFSCKSLINIHDVVTHSDYRRQGIASSMLDKVAEIATSRGCCKLTLEVLEGNIAAREAYLKLGFKAYQLDPELGQAMFWEKSL